MTSEDYNVEMKPAWCPGCGNFGILAAVKKAFAGLDLRPDKVLMVSGIGQSGKLPHYMKCNLFNELHGREIPAAIGAKIANRDLVVIAEGGDGGAYGEGGNHWLHAMRRNHDITYIVHNNQIYGLTKGQASPTSDLDFITGTTPAGAPSPINPITIALACDVSFVARGFAGDIEHLSSIIIRGVQHKGFALIDILQPCVTFNHKNTFTWYSQRVYKLDDDAGYNPGDRTAAIAKAMEWGDKIPTGVIYQKTRQVFEDRLPGLGKSPLVKQAINPAPVKSLFKEFY